MQSRGEKRKGRERGEERMREEVKREEGRGEEEMEKEGRIAEKKGEKDRRADEIRQGNSLDPDQKFGL